MKSLAEIKKTISKLQIVDLNRNDASDLIEKIITEDLVEIPFPNKIFEPGLKLHRCRNNNNKPDFETVDSLSFRTDTENIKEYGRANKKNQSIFYSSDVRPTAMLETSMVFRGDAYSSIDTFTITTGHWESIKELKLVMLVSHTNAQEKNELIKLYNIDIVKFTKDVFKTEADKVFEILNFICDEFSVNTNGNCNLYKISAAFSNYAFQKSDGILYPSLQRRFEGLNFAIKPDSVRDKLQFRCATRDKFIKTDEIQYQHSEIKESIEIRDTKIIWGEPKEIKTQTNK
ncbi:MAG: hypothetical protein WA816_09390 [Bacteroidales bacterium]